MHSNKDIMKWKNGWIRVPPAGITITQFFFHKKTITQFYFFNTLIFNFFFWLGDGDCGAKTWTPHSEVHLLDYYHWSMPWVPLIFKLKNGNSLESWKMDEIVCFFSFLPEPNYVCCLLQVRKSNVLEYVDKSKEEPTSKFRAIAVSFGVIMLL